MEDADDRSRRLEEAIRQKRARRSRRTEISRRPSGEPARLSRLQRTLWLAHRLEPDSADYHLVDAYRTTQLLDHNRLQTALRQVVDRHRLLRSTFQAKRHDVEQLINSVPLEAFVVERLATSNSEDAAAKVAHHPFDLQRGPLVRLYASDHLLVLVLHHILADETSLGIFWRDFSDAYAGRSTSTAPRIQFDDFIAWSAPQNLQRRAEALDYWRPRLTPPPATLDLPFDPQGQAREPGRLSSRAFPAELTQSVRTLAASTGTTPFVVCAFAYRLLVDRLSQGETVAIATPVSTRFHPAVANVLGYFTNAVLLPFSTTEGAPLDQAMRAFGEDTRQSIAHSHLAFTDLVEDLDPPRSIDQHPIFQTMFVYRQPADGPTLGATPLEPVTLDLRVAKFDLTLFVTEQPSGLEIAVEFRTKRYGGAGVRRLMDLYTTLLEAIATGAPECLVDEISLVSAEESRQLQELALGVRLEDTTEVMPHLIRQVSRGRAADSALVCGASTSSYSELMQRADDLAARLATLSVCEGDRVGLYLERSPSLITSILGCHILGAAYVPLDPSYPPDRNRVVLEDAEVKVVLTSVALEGSLPSGPWQIVHSDPPGATAPPAPESQRRDPSPRTPAYLLYTSGSTGRPKGVVISHDNLRHSNAARAQYYGVDRSLRPDRFLLIPSLAFDSSVAGLFWTLGVGGTLVLPTDAEATEPRRLVELVARERIDSLLCVPSLYAQLLLSARARDDRPLRSLTSVIVAGESCPWALVAQHFRDCPEVRLFNEYGPTEATVWASVAEITPETLAEHDPSSPVPIGRPIPGVQVQIEDPSGRPVPVGVPGVAWVAGPTVAAGYWRQPESTAEHFRGQDPHRRYCTGDRVRWSSEGQLLFLGRVDEQIKLRGIRLEPGEIEALAQGWPDVRAAAVVVTAGGVVGGNERLILFVEGTTPLDWRQRLVDHLPPAMVPSAVVELDQLPRLPNQKIDRRAVAGFPIGETHREPSFSDHSRPGAEILTTSQLALTSLWQGLLGISEVGLDDNFFELGGHSLLVAEMALAIERDFEVQIAAADVFQNPTVRELSRCLSGNGAGERYDHLFPLQPTGPGAPFVVAIPHFFADLFANRLRGQRPVYGLRGVSLRAEGNLGRWPTMASLAEELADEICARFPEDTASESGRGLYLAGYSFGASMAAETTHVLEGRGVTILGLYLVTPMALNFRQFGPFRIKVRQLEETLDDLGSTQTLARILRDYNPLSVRPYRYSWRWLRVQPKRRFLSWIGRVFGALGRPLSPAILHADVRADRFRMHKGYRPRTITAPTILFNAKTNALEPGTNSAATWKTVFRGPLTVVDVPDPHLDETSVQSARESIADHLEKLKELP